ncbi:MAG: cytochrome c biogenesis protein ResB [Actinomycetota bacterium]|nr:cytochrome c biogenesis protein ResB [Actinomycetota bacterium]MDH5223327.1 cytochrome c biogenesis protein ResB [Actinomycetota bacterium]MDH5313072.1 cytochrome c biogenesis protein ResB [Actinomycetota bacterium]
MRTALILLLLIAVASVAGSLLPQWPNSAQRVAQYRGDHPVWGSLFERAGLFDVFGSWWFVLLTTLLFVSLVACLVPRTRALWRALRTPPMQAREIDAFPSYAEVPIAAAPGAAIEVARRALRRHRYRVARDPSRPALAGEKGVAREIGSLVFHWAFILLLAGVIYGKGTGFSGLIAVVEGQTWVDAEANYDGTIRSGRFFDGFTGIGLHLREFGSDFLRSGQPMDFVSRVDLLDPSGSVIRSEDIRVNSPAKLEGLWIYQSSFGWAPVIEVVDRGEVVSSGPVVMDRDAAPDGVVEFAMPWRGIVKLPGAGEGGRDRAIELELWPDSRGLAALLEGGEPQAMLVAFDPLIRFTVWEGRLTDLATSRLDTTSLREVSSGIVGAGRTADLVDGRALAEGDRGSGSTISFPELRQYSVFLVSRDAGVSLVLAAAILILVGLLPALYSSRRKIWVRADPDGDGAVLRVGGLAMQRKPQFAEEFTRLVGDLASAAGERTPRQPEPDDREKARTP